jgi:hypothetical protein
LDAVPLCFPRPVFIDGAFPEEVLMGIDVVGRQTASSLFLPHEQLNVLERLLL